MKFKNPKYVYSTSLWVFCIFVVDEKPAQLIRFVNLIEENYTKGPCMTYAELLSIPLRTLSNLTQQLFNEKLSEMICETIILEAKDYCFFLN